MNEDFKFYWSWRSVGALVYFGICIVDLVGMPIYREWSYNRVTAAELVAMTQSIPDPATRIEAIQVLKADRSWEPVTDEMFHLSFGAILGISAFSRSGSGFTRRKGDGAVGGGEDDPTAMGRLD